MRSLIIVEVEHGDTTDGVNECLFDMGIGSQFDPESDDQWPTARDGASWPRVIPGGIDYRVVTYCVRVDTPAAMVIDLDMPSVEALHKMNASTFPKE